ncbi:MAG: efflux RND transporter permease subunit [Saprospiraceae bacterium]|nr:efflux RND transporter permease subunit [Saprospiraceae bacterium]
MDTKIKNGLAGKIAEIFIKSKLTVLLMFVFIAIGIYSTLLIPREEEPQIKIPIADILFFPAIKEEIPAC